MDGHEQQRGFTHTRHTVDFPRHRGFELPAIGQAGQGVAAGQVTQAVHDRLQPGPTTRHQVGRRLPPCLLQQRQRLLETKRPGVGPQGHLVGRGCLGRHGGSDGGLLNDRGTRPV